MRAILAGVLLSLVFLLALLSTVALLKPEDAKRIRVTFNRPPVNISGHVCVFADGAMECVDIETYMRYAAMKHAEVSE